MNYNARQVFPNPAIHGLLTIIIVTYKQKEFIFEAIDSVLTQDYPKIELIISDDGSDYFNSEQIKQYIINHQKGNILNTIIITRKRNIGTVKNINKALKCSSGEFIKILGGDDSYPSPETFSLQVNDLEKKHSLVSIGKAQQCDYYMRTIFDERISRSNESLPLIMQMNYPSALKFISKNDIFPIAIQALCYRRLFFELYGMCDEDYILIDDSPSVIKILKNIKKASFLNIITVNHRSKVGISSSKEMFAPHRLQYYKDCITYSKKEIDAHPELYSWIYRKESIRINTFVYKVAKAKKENRIIIPFLVILYSDTIIYYALTRPRKLIKRIIERIIS